MAQKTYREKLLDPRWQRRRLEVLQRTDFRCAHCDSSEKTLHVHHLRYIRGHDPWEYSDEDLRPLCEECHAEWHELRARLDESLARIWDHELVIGFVEGIRAACSDDKEAARFEALSESWVHGYVDGFNSMWGEPVRVNSKDVMNAMERGGWVTHPQPWENAKKRVAEQSPQ